MSNRAFTSKQIFLDPTWQENLSGIPLNDDNFEIIHKYSMLFEINIVYQTAKPTK
jgi:hypothetical protein